MKKQALILIGITGAFLFLLLGVFLGRNLNKSYISIQEPASVQTKATESGSQEYDGKIDINTATVQQLQMLPGIGETIAQRIIDYRTEHGNFDKTEDLMNVSGIGEKKFENIRDYIKVG